MPTPDFLIIGGGIIGLSVAKALHEKQPGARVTVLEKERQVACHGSGRNSGVLHAGFYYPSDSLKARFCRDGSRAWREYCKEHHLALNACGKLVVAKDASEIAGLRELKRRGDANGVRVDLITQDDAKAIEPKAVTHEQALYSPDTATVDPRQISYHLRDALKGRGVEIKMSCGYERRLGGNRIEAGGEIFEAGHIINCAGLYADRVAKDFGFGEQYTIMPFKGIYLTYQGADTPLKTHIYPVPNLKNPFLGVHFTLTADGHTKIGPTAIPAMWRQNYKGLQGFNAKEMIEISSWQCMLFMTDAFGFRHLALEEMKKYRRQHLINLAAKMVKDVDMAQFTHWSTPGIRAQLLNKSTRSLVQDFVVEADASSTHVLNAVSPAFTCSLPFGEWVAEKILCSR